MTKRRLHVKKKTKSGLSWVEQAKRQLPFWVMLAIPIVYFALFKYWSWFGIAIAFQDYKLGDPFIGAGSRWVGLKWFKLFFKSPFVWRWIKNTLLISVNTLIFSFPAGIFLALLFNEIKNLKFREAATTISMLPHFVSTVVVVGILHNLFSVQGGIVNQVIEKLGGNAIDFMGSSKWFRPLYIGSGIWQGTGFASLVYVAAISGIDPGLYEAAKMDGANRWKQMWHVTLPCILPTIITMFILKLGNLMSVGAEKILLMYSPAIYETADVLSTYAYRAGILDGKTSLSTAISLMNSVVNLIVLVTANKVSRKVSETSLW